MLPVLLHLVCRIGIMDEIFNLGLDNLSHIGDNTVHYQIEIYRKENAREPYSEWFDRLRDHALRVRVRKRLVELGRGNWGDYKSVGSKVFELRCHFGGGLRIYFLRDGKKIIVLLCGGNKNTQERDIRQAIEYAKNYVKNKG